MKHVVLLGDSIFDNAAYVAGGPDVLEQLREHLPSGWRATLKAVDGAVTSSVRRQLDGLPSDASHLVVSAGGNDALGRASVLNEEVCSMVEAVDRLADVQQQFGRDYRAMLDAVAGCGRPMAVCTIYDARFPGPREQRRAAAALTIFSDCITRDAFARGLPMIDLRLVCDRNEDHANPIDPSVRGGAKIAAAIARLVTEGDSGRRRSEVFVR